MNNKVISNQTHINPVKTPFGLEAQIHWLVAKIFWNMCDILHFFMNVRAFILQMI